MTEILKLIRDAVGVRPLVPLLLIIGIGYLFKLFRDYPVRELLYDRYYLLSVLLIVSASLGYVIFNSATAERTPEGRFGVYVARFADDPDASLTTRVVEALKATLDGKAREAQIRLEVRDLRHELTDQEDDQRLREQTRQLNAAAVIWGRAVDKSNVYVRLWSEGTGLARSPEPVNVTEIAAVAKLASDVWDRIERVRRSRSDAAERSADGQLGAEISRLRAEISELRGVVTAALVSRSGASAAPAASANPSAVLVGIAAYPDFPLAGPVNDVVALTEALRTRGRNWSINTLLDKDATGAKIQENILRAATSTPPQETLLVFLSGHGAIEKDLAYFVPYDFDMKGSVAGKALDVRALVTQTLKAHARTVFLIDSPFDPAKLPEAQTQEAAVMTAGSRPEAIIETNTKGKTMGAFTTAVVQALTSAPPNTSVTVKDLHATVRALLRDRRDLPKGGDPLLLAGPQAPTL